MVSVRKTLLIEVLDDYGNVIDTTRLPYIGDPAALAQQGAALAHQGAALAQQGAALPPAASPIPQAPASQAPASPAPEPIPLVETDADVQEMFGRVEFHSPEPRPVLGDDGRPIIRRERRHKGPRPLGGDSEGAPRTAWPGLGGLGLGGLGGVTAGYDDDDADFNAIA